MSPDGLELVLFRANQVLPLYLLHVKGVKKTGIKTKQPKNEEPERVTKKAGKSAKKIGSNKDIKKNKKKK
jgi:hypothetical protein